MDRKISLRGSLPSKGSVLCVATNAAKRRNVQFNYERIDDEMTPVNNEIVIVTVNNEIVIVIVIVTVTVVVNVSDESSSVLVEIDQKEIILVLVEIEAEKRGIG